MIRMTKKNINFSSFDIDADAYTSRELMDNGVDEGSIVYMLGYPMGLVNVNSKLPLCRLGCIAVNHQYSVRWGK